VAEGETFIRGGWNSQRPKGNFGEISAGEKREERGEGREKRSTVGGRANEKWMREEREGVLGFASASSCDKGAWPLVRMSMGGAGGGGSLSDGDGLSGGGSGSATTSVETVDKAGRGLPPT